MCDPRKDLFSFLSICAAGSVVERLVANEETRVRFSGGVRLHARGRGFDFHILLSERGISSVGRALASHPFSMIR